MLRVIFLCGVILDVNERRNPGCGLEEVLISFGICLCKYILI